MSQPPPVTTSTRAGKPSSSLIHSVLSYDSNIMLAAIISLLLVILFVLLLHFYAKWFLAQARQRSGRSVSVPQVLGARFHHFHTITIDNTYAISPTKGLDTSAISSIPLFVFKSGKHEHELECVICLSVFADEEVCRKLPKCDHAFHVECIDMWLHSHATCPICRAPAVRDNTSMCTSTSTSSNTSSSLNIEQVGNQQRSEESMLEEASGELRMMRDDESVTDVIVEVSTLQNISVETNQSLSSNSSITRTETCP